MQYRLQVNGREPGPWKRGCLGIEVRDVDGLRPDETASLTIDDDGVSLCIGVAADDAYRWARDLDRSYWEECSLDDERYDEVRADLAADLRRERAASEAADIHAIDGD